MKKRILILIVGALLLLFIVVIDILNHSERRIKTFVLNNEYDLKTICDSYLNNDTSIKTFKNAEVDGLFKGEHDIVQFFYSGFGIAPATKYYGFYYSEDDEPAAFQNINITLVEKGNNEWVWSDGTDNGGITKRIKENWFYYEAWF